MSQAFSSLGPGQLPLEISFSESRALWAEHKINKEIEINPFVAKAIVGGEVLGKWLKKINKNRRSDNQLYLTSSISRGPGIPIDRPSKYGPKTIEVTLTQILTNTPKEMISVIYNKNPMTITSPVSDKLFIEHGRKISRVYQSAVRWETNIKKWLPWYKRNRKRDVRGFYYLNKEEGLDEKLTNFTKLSSEDQSRLRSHLLKVCLNSSMLGTLCKSSLKKAVSNNLVLKFKNKYWSGAQRNWNTFWKITNPRKDVTWNSSAPNSMKVLFKDPKNAKIANWLKENIEDEFKNETWQMEFNLVPGRAGISYLKFKPGVTPHVTGGNIIVMDANASTKEYSVRWTIRHEYGHILRLPDCYVEFYDSEEELAVNYQLDVTDLMCSRSGNFNQRIFDELKSVYYTK